MHALRHLAGGIFFCLLFLLGKIVAERRELWAQSLRARIPDRGRVSNFFLYSGRTIETVSAVGAFIEMVAVLVLVSDI